MAFVRRKGKFFYLVSSYRDPDKKPRQRVLAYFGEPPVPLARFEKIKAKFPGLNWKQLAEVLKPKDPGDWIKELIKGADIGDLLKNLDL